MLYNYFNRKKYLQERFSPKNYRLMNCVWTTKELSSNRLITMYLDEQLIELEISKADSHISNPDEIEEKLKEDSFSEESKK